MQHADLIELPPRRLLSADVREDTDDLGFLADVTSRHASPLEVLLKPGMRWVVAGPWYGKSWLSSQIEKALRRHHERSSGTSLFGHYVRLIGFETFGRAEAPVPTWWREWQASSDRACLLVDAVDEDLRRDDRHTFTLLNAIDDLDPAQRDRLCLTLFCRDSERDPAVEDHLANIYGHDQTATSDSPRVLRLPRLTREEAQDLVGSREQFDAVQQMIRDNHLQPIAGIPIVLETLAKHTPHPPGGIADTWRLVLQRLLEPQSHRRRAMASTPSERFQAAARMGAVLTFSGADMVADGAYRNDLPSLDDFFPRHPLSAENTFRTAAKEVLPYLCERGADGYRFRQHHVQEWFAAFAVANVTPDRLRPLLIDESGAPLADQAALHGLLRMCGSTPVQKLIDDLYGGVPPKADSHGWTLADSIRVLDAIQHRLRRSRSPIWFWSDERLQALNIPGFGEVLAERLNDREQPPPVLHVLLQIARACQAAEATDAAFAIAADPEVPADIRVSAVTTLDTLARDDAIRRLRDMRGQVRGEMKDARRLQAAILLVLYRRELIPWEEAVAVAPTGDPHVVDMPEMLWHELKDAMTLPRARWLARTDGAEPLLQASSESGATPARRGRLELLASAFQLILSQDEWTAEDIDLLIPIALGGISLERQGGSGMLITQAFAKHRDARRALFLAGLAQDPERKRKARHRYYWQGPLQSDDVAWLADVARKHRTASPWIDQYLLNRLEHEDVPQALRRRIRAEIDAARPGLIAEFDRKRRDDQQEMHKWEAEERRRKRQREHQMVDLEDEVRRTLESQTTSCHRMRQIAALCFPQHGGGFWNVRGRWEDLPQPLQDEAIEVVKQGLSRCKPTEIAIGDTFSSWVAYEADAFVAVHHHDPAFVPNANQVRNWLPAVLRIASPSDEATVKRCFEAHPAEAESAVLQELQRGLRSEPPRIHSIERLPAEFWSNQLAEGVLALTTSASVSVEARGDLLRVLAFRAPEHALDLARRWIGIGASATEPESLAAIDTLLVTDPAVALHELKRRHQQNTPVDLSKLTTLRRRGGEAVHLEKWSAVDLSSLYLILRDTYPPTSDPQREPGRAYHVGRDDELRDMRDDIIRGLLERQDASSQEALDDLSHRFTDVQRWVEHVRTEAAVGDVLTQAPARSSVVAPSAPRVVRLLEDEAYRLIRDGEDLRRILVKELHRIAEDVKHHLAMLYRPPQNGQRERLHEEALQAYLACRLRDRLEDRVLDGPPVVHIQREPVEAKNQRDDLQVIATTIAGNKAEVVIEVKWSDNPQALNGLVEQLGQRYLVEQNRTDGVYVVGWNGSGNWKSDIGYANSPISNAPEAWRHALEQAATVFCREHTGVAIDVVVMDLRW